MLQVTMLILNKYKCDFVMIAYGNILYNINVPTENGLDVYRLVIPVSETNENDVFKPIELAGNLMKWIKQAMIDDDLTKIYQRKFEDYGK